MADASHDAIVIGGGTKGLSTALYLQRYGGMQVAIFEKRYELGGGWTSDESPALGFIADCHVTSIGGPGGRSLYFKPVEEDFPEFCSNIGPQFIEWSISKVIIFKEDATCIVIYPRSIDPTQERSAQTIASFSPKDAETWIQLNQRWAKVIAPAMEETHWNPPPPPGVPSALERVLHDPPSAIDPSWFVKSRLEVARELFESEAVVAGILRSTHSARNRHRCIH